MRAILLVLALLLSGCAVAFESEPIDEVRTTSTCTVNGQQVPCGGGNVPTGPKEPVHVDVRDAIGTGLDRSWGFSVHPNATQAEFVVRIVGAEDQAGGVRASSPCVTLSSPGMKSSWGTCGGAISISPMLVVDGVFEWRADKQDLPPRDYTLQVVMGPAAADYAVAIDVDY